MYFCEFCNYSTIRKNDFEKHNKTDKHNEILKNLIVYGVNENSQKKPIRSSTNEHKRAQTPKKIAQKEHKSSTNVLFCSQKSHRMIIILGVSIVKSRTRRRQT